jgi:hypothetical protein
MVLQIHPPSIEAEQAGQLEDRWVGEVKRRDERRLTAANLGLDLALMHG